MTKYKNKYDENGNVISIAEYCNGRKTPDTKTKMTYDENGNKVSEEYIILVESDD